MAGEWERVWVWLIINVLLLLSLVSHYLIIFDEVALCESNSLQLLRHSSTRHCNVVFETWIGCCCHHFIFRHRRFSDAEIVVNQNRAVKSYFLIRRYSWHRSKFTVRENVRWFARIYVNFQMENAIYCRLDLNVMKWNRFWFDLPTGPVRLNLKLHSVKHHTLTYPHGLSQRRFTIFIFAIIASA